MKIILLAVLAVAVSASPVIKSPQDQCSTCEEVVNTIYEFVKNPAMKGEVLSLIEQVCTFFGAEAAECKALVQAYGGQILDLIISELSDSKALCQKLGLCGASKQKIFAAIFRKTVLPHYLSGVIKSRHLKKELRLNSPKDECTTCKEVVNTIYLYISNPEMEKEAIALIEQVCTYFGAEASICKTLVEQYGLEILKMIIAELSDADKVCKEIGLCTASKVTIKAALLQKAIPSHHLKLTPKRHVLKASYPVKASEECVLCEFVAKELDGMLAKNSTQQEIISAVEKVCSLMPSTIKTKCDEYVEKYGQAIISILSQELSPKLICTTLGLCSSKEHRIAMMKPHKLIAGSNEPCEICTDVMMYLKNLLKDNSTDAEIIAGLEKVCNFLPAQIASECNAIVTEYGQELLKLIANSDAKALCTEIGLCSSKFAMQLKSRPGHVEHRKCYLGASYWCASRGNAIGCNAVHFCKKHSPKLLWD